MHMLVANCLSDAFSDAYSDAFSDALSVDYLKVINEIPPRRRT